MGGLIREKKVIFLKVNYKVNTFIINIIIKFFIGFDKFYGNLSWRINV